MGIQLSSLTLTERSFQSLYPPTALALKARQVAHSYISDRGGPRGQNEAISFLRNEAKIRFDINRSLIALDDSAPPAELPKSYGLKGGAARERLVATLGIRAPRTPRDLDLVRRGYFRNKEDEVVAHRFMARDYALGARVELIRDVERYLASRDITINEVASFNPQLYVSVLALLDSIGHVLRPSYYRSGTLHKAPSLEGKILLKMIRLFAEGECAGESWLLVGIPDQITISEFDLAIHLNKAFQRGRDVAEKFIHTCTVLSLLPAAEDPVGSILAELEHLRHGERGLFPDVPVELWPTKGL